MDNMQTNYEGGSKPLPVTEQSLGDVFRLFVESSG
jgi:hypothetical protein